MSEWTKERSEVLRALLAKATPGPWRRAAHGTYEVEAQPNTLVADCGLVGCASADADLIVAARNELPDLLAALDAERAAHEETRRGADLYRADRDYHCDRAIRLERERDEAQAALVALREAAGNVVCDVCPYHDDEDDCDTSCSDGNAHEALRAALAATPPTLAGQVRARVLREAARECEAMSDDHEVYGVHASSALATAAQHLSRLADEAER